MTPPGVVTEQKFTQPPPRYTEGSLVRELEERGIGRPSTYAEIISKVQARDYVEKIDGTRFRPTTLGKFVVDGLVQSELDFMDPAFTSKMEEELDEVEAGKEERVGSPQALLQAVPRSSSTRARRASAGTRSPTPTDEKCDIDGGEMLKRWSKNGWFLGCANYPKCKNTRDLGARRQAAPPYARRASTATSAASRWSSAAAATASSCRAPGTPSARTRARCRSACHARSAAGDLIEIRPKKRGGKHVLRLLELRRTKPSSATSSSGRSPSRSLARAAARRSWCTAGTRLKPMIACANKECGYKRPVAEASEVGAGEGAAEGTAVASAEAGAGVEAPAAI